MSASARVCARRSYAHAAGPLHVCRRVILRVWQLVGGGRLVQSWQFVRWRLSHGGGVLMHSGICLDRVGFGRRVRGDSGDVCAVPHWKLVRGFCSSTGHLYLLVRVLFCCWCCHGVRGHRRVV